MHTALDDTQLVRFQDDLFEQIGEHRATGVIIDVAALDVLDSFGARTLRRIAEMARLRGVATVIVGIQPDVAFAMVQLGMGTGNVPTALDLEEGLDYLAALTGPSVRVPAGCPGDLRDDPASATRPARWGRGLTPGHRSSLPHRATPPSRSVRQRVPARKAPGSPGRLAPSPTSLRRVGGGRISQEDGQGYVSRTICFRARTS